MKRFLLVLIAFLSMVVVEAAPVSAQRAAERVSHMGLRQFRSRASGAGTLTLAYTAPGDSYYVFNRADGGYVIAPGDDRCVAVLAMTDAGTFDYEHMAPGAREWIDACGRQLSEIIATPESNEMMEAESGNDIASLYAKWTAINPLVSSRWNQSWPYNIMCPVKDGRRCMTGCVATAMAQVIRANGYYNGNGYHSQGSGDAFVEFDYGATDFNFDVMTDNVSINDSNETLNSVASLMLACGLSVGMNYGTDSSGALSESVASALIENFGYSADYTRFLLRSKYTVAQWESIVYSELSLGRPVLYFGSSGDSSHAFVVDGYAPAGLWHINWGWGGMSDGYFALTLLNPAQQGIGGSSGGYSENQRMVRAVIPGADPGLRFKLIAGSISSVGDDLFALYFQTTDEAVSGVGLGVVIYDADERPVASVTFWNDQNIGSTTTLRSDGYYYDFSSLNLSQGEYRIYPAYKADDDATMEIAEPFTGRQYYVALTVDENGCYTYSNPTVEAPIGAVVRVAEVSDNPLYSGYNADVVLTLVNNGGSDFSGDIMVNLLTESGDAVRSVKANSIKIPTNYNTLFSVSIAGVDADGIPLEAGAYNLTVTDTSGNRFHEGMYDIAVLKAIPPTYQQTNSDISIYNASQIPKTIMQGDSWTHRPDVYVAKSMTADIRVGFYQNGSAKLLKSYTVRTGSLSRTSGFMNIESFAVDVPFGIYQVAYLNRTSSISGKQTVAVGVREGDLYYYPLSVSEVAVAPHPDKAYSGDIVVPERVAINGNSYGVTALSVGAFEGCTGITSLVIPPGVNVVGTNSFALCSGLKYIMYGPEQISFTYRNHVAPGMSEDAEIYTSVSAFDALKTAFGERNDVYVVIKSVESKSVVLSGAEQQSVTLTVDPMHQAINDSFAIISNDNSFDPAAEIVGYTVEAGAIKLEVKPLLSGTSTFEIQSAQPGLDAAHLEVTVENLDGIVETSEDRPSFEVTVGQDYIDIHTSTRTEVISIDGRVCAICETPSRITLSPGIYIVRCVHRTVKVRVP